MIIWLASYPRSGNTYFRILLKQLYGIETYSLYRDQEIADYPDICQIVGHRLRDKSLAEMAQAEEWYIIKTHELPNDDSPAIYLARDGRDVLVSYAAYLLTYEKGLRQWEPALMHEILGRLITDPSYFGGWGAHILLWCGRQAPTAVIPFEKLVRYDNPKELLQQAFQQIGFHPAAKTNVVALPEFSELQQRMPQFFRNGRIGGWQVDMPQEMQNLFWQYHAEAMHVISDGSNIHIQAEKTRLTASKLLRAQQQALRDKEQVIQELLQTIQHIEQYPLRPFLKRYLPHLFVKGIRFFRQRFQPKLGQLQQYQPIKVSFTALHGHSFISSLQAPCPKISILTPSFNQGQFLERTIISVLEQQYPQLEYIIQDGASTDNTKDILSRYQPYCHYIASQSDTGQAQAINRGFRQASGKIMAWLNADDVLLPGALVSVAHFFQAHPEADVVYGHRIIINAQDQEIGRWILPPHDDKVLRWADWIPQETLFWRRRIWEKAGGYVDESFQFALDWELLLRFRAAGAQFVRLPRFLAAFRVHPQQKTSRDLEGPGRQEMAQLRAREHGHAVSEREAIQQSRGYLRKHLVYDWLYRWKILPF
jgi:glycosyltransferase involved in cell wall biosynthesis